MVLCSLGGENSRVRLITCSSKGSRKDRKEPAKSTLSWIDRRDSLQKSDSESAPVRKRARTHARAQAHLFMHRVRIFMDIYLRYYGHAAPECVKPHGGDIDTVNPCSPLIDLNEAVIVPLLCCSCLHRSYLPRRALCPPAQ